MPRILPPCSSYSPDSARLSMTSELDFDHDMMAQALIEARKCVPKVTAFCVGCILVARYRNSAPVILARAYSRELEGNTHAEANALSKARSLSKDQIRGLFPDVVGDPPSIDELLRISDVYTTMEPCSVRTSGLAPCTGALVTAGVARCIIGVGEPDDFVLCEGAQKMKQAGIEVVWLKGMEDECLKVARTGHSTIDARSHSGT